MQGQKLDIQNCGLHFKGYPSRPALDISSSGETEPAYTSSFTANNSPPPNLPLGSGMRDAFKSSSRFSLRSVHQGVYHKSLRVLHN